MVELYKEHNLLFTDISEVLNCHPETAKAWVSRLANPRVVTLDVEVSDDFTVDVYANSENFTVSLDGFESDFFDDEDVVLEESEDGEKYIKAGIIHSSGTEMLEDSAPVIESDESDWVVFPTGYKFAGEEVVEKSITSVRELL